MSQRLIVLCHTSISLSLSLSVCVYVYVCVSALRWSPSGTAVTIAGMQAQGEPTGTHYPPVCASSLCVSCACVC